MKRSIGYLIFVFTFSACTQVSIHYYGTYEWSDGFGGNRVDLDSNYTFRAWWWSDVGGYHEGPSTIGKWKKTDVSGVIELTGDKLPIFPKVTSDSGVSGFRIMILPEDSLTFVGLVYVDIACADTHSLFLIDSTRSFEWKGNTPQRIRVYQMGSFTVEHTVLSSTQPDEEFRYDGNAMMTFGNATKNVLTVVIQDQYSFLNKSKYFLQVAHP